MVIPMLGKGHLFALATAFVSGCSIFYNSFAVKGFDPLAFTVAKNSLAALFLIGIALSIGHWGEISRLSRRQWLTLFAIAIIGGSIPFALFFQGLAIAQSASTASFLYRMLFIFASVLAVFFLRERPSPKVLAGVALIFAANALLIGKIGFGSGEILVLAATVLWAGENILSKKALAEISPSVVGAARMALGSAILVAMLFATGNFSLASSGSMFGSAAIISALFLTLYVATYYRALALIPVTEATAILSAGGIVTALLSFAFSGKIPTLSEAISLLLIACGVVLLLGFNPIPGAAQKLAASIKKRPMAWKA